MSPPTMIHYWNVAGYTDVADRSGVSMCTTTSLRPKTAVVSTLGSANIDLPPRSSGKVVTGKCTPQITEPIHVLSANPHMHGRGRKLRTDVLRGGSAATVDTLVDEPAFDFQFQRAHASELRTDHLGLIGATSWSPPGGWPRACTALRRAHLPWLRSRGQPARRGGVRGCARSWSE